MFRLVTVHPSPGSTGGGAPASWCSPVGGASCPALTTSILPPIPDSGGFPGPLYRATTGIVYLNSAQFLHPLYLKPRSTFNVPRRHGTNALRTYIDAINAQSSALQTSTISVMLRRRPQRASWTKSGKIIVKRRMIPMYGQSG